MFSLVGLVVLVLDVIALVSLLKSSADSGTKILWGASHHPVAGGRNDPLLPDGTRPPESHLTFAG
jgi:hypothetical protein